MCPIDLHGNKGTRALNIRHSTGSYEVRFGDYHSALQTSGHTYVITDQNIEPLYRRFLEGTEHLAVPAGEASKSMDQYGKCLDWLVSRGANRKSTLVAFGGGVIGDLGGFVAATFMRGMRYIQVPTSLVAQVDSSVGGKVAIDLPSAKNIAGSFYPPAEVIIDVRTLETLPANEFTNGTAEIWKYALGLDGKLFHYLEAAPVSLQGDISRIITRCVEIKAEVVQEDEFETTGSRARLNVGHTVGHALEQVTGFAVPHGLAVSIGMSVETKIGEAIGVTEAGTSTIVDRVLQMQGLPVWHDSLDRPEQLVHAMQADKKRSAGGLAFALIETVGKSKLIDDLSSTEIVQIIRNL